MKRAILVLAIAALALGCKRQKAPVAKRIWLGPRGGCMTTLEHPTTGTFACWGWVPPNREDAAFASKRSLPVDASASATPLDLGISDGFVCSIEAKDASDVRCYWGGGGHSERTETVPGKVVSVAGGSAGVCAAATEGVECWNISPFDPKPWARNAKVRAVAVGDHHLCAAYEGLGVRCRGVKTAGKEDVGDAARASLDFDDPALDATALAAGESHTCALLANHTVKCWGKNDSGQLGDGTTNDSKTPVEVLGISSVARITAGRAHTCALIGNGTVHCWGNNAHHQLANGETKNDGRAKMVLGILGVSAVSASADATCAILSKDGEVRCWGQNDKGQLGDSTLQEHTVPAAVRFH